METSEQPFPPIEYNRIDESELVHSIFEIKSEYDFKMVEKLLDLMVLQSDTDTNTYRTLILQQRAYYQRYKHEKGVN